MPCRHFTVRGPDGQPMANAIICGPKPRRRRCSACGELGATRECDWKVGRDKTCDALLCERCTTQPRKDKDLCPAHAQAWRDWEQRRAASAPVAKQEVTP